MAAASEISLAKSANGAALGALAMFSPKASAAAWPVAMTPPETALVERLCFASRRFQAQAYLLSGMLVCQDADLLLDAQSCFARDAVTDSEREATTMTGKLRAAAVGRDGAADGARRA